MSFVVPAPRGALRYAPLSLGPLGTNAVILAAGQELVLVDPAAEPERLLAALASMQGTVREVWLTHAHFDHLGALAEVHRAYPQVPLRLHPADLPLYRQAVAMAAAFGLELESPPPAETLRPFADGDVVRVGDVQGRCLHLPGHAPGHVVFRFEGAGLAVVGDTLFCGGIGRSDLPYGDQEALLDGIAQHLLTLPDDAVFVPGHGPAGTIGEERRSNPFL